MDLEVPLHMIIDFHKSKRFDLVEISKMIIFWTSKMPLSLLFRWDAGQKNTDLTKGHFESQNIFISFFKNILELRRI